MLSARASYHQSVTSVVMHTRMIYHRSAISCDAARGRAITTSVVMHTRMIYHRSVISCDAARGRAITTSVVMHTRMIYHRSVTSVMMHARG